MDTGGIISDVEVLYRKLIACVKFFDFLGKDLKFDSIFGILSKYRFDSMQFGKRLESFFV